MSELLWLVKRLKDAAKELNDLPEEEIKMIIERIDKEEPWALKKLYDSLNEYMGW